MDLTLCKSTYFSTENFGNVTTELIELLYKVQWEPITFKGRSENCSINCTFLNSGVHFQNFSMPMEFEFIADVYIDYYSYIIIAKRDNLYFLIHQNTDFYWYDDKFVCHNSLEELVHYGLCSKEKFAFIEKIKESLEELSFQSKIQMDILIDTFNNSVQL